MKPSIVAKLEALHERHEEVQALLGDAQTIADQERFRALSREYAQLSDVSRCFTDWQQVQEDIETAQMMLDDPEMREMAQDELREAKEKSEQLEQQLQVLLLPKDPDDERNAFLEVRAGTGGDEATLFAAEILRMYARYAERQGWKMEIMDAADTGVGGIKEAFAMIEGDNVYSKMRYESGVHRVQRVPQTETQGRIHTSAITVAVLPEAEEVDVKIDPKDLRVDYFCSSGPGGQSVNTTYSAVRLTHLPTNVVVSMQDEKSQIKNKEKAMRILRARLQEIEEQKQHDALSAERKSMVGSGDRSEKIRTYNFKENRVTDHRIGLTVHQLDLVMEGQIDEFVEALRTHYQTEKLKAEAVAA